MLLQVDDPIVALDLDVALAERARRDAWRTLDEAQDENDSLGIGLVIRTLMELL